MLNLDTKSVNLHQQRTENKLGTKTTLRLVRVEEMLPQGGKWGGGSRDWGAFYSNDFLEFFRWYINVLKCFYDLY